MSLLSKYHELKQQLKATSQDHLISHINEDNINEYQELLQQLTRIDINRVLHIFHDAKSTPVTIDAAVKPVESISVDRYPDHERQNIIESGRAAIRSGTVAAVILSGGQGTRLGFAGPKGMYDIGLLSHKSIFQLHIEKILRLKELLNGDIFPMIYVMTSDLNDAVIRQYFEDHQYFGYPHEHIMFFEQGLQPCLSNDGKLMLESEKKLSMAPDGNGGIYLALESSGAIADMTKRGVQHLHVYGIDNVLTKSLDPNFIGLCIYHEAEVGNKVVWRANKAEKVGVTVCDDAHHMRILEYSEIPTDLAEAEDDTGKLVFGAANICNHYFCMAFIRDKVLTNISHTYHIAKKKIPNYDTSSGHMIMPTSNNGMKLEMFIFDVFPMAIKWIVAEAKREDEFAPVKNEPGNAVDSPDTARVLISNQNKHWLRAAGAALVDEHGVDASLNDSLLCEISCRVSYAGENLESFHGKQIVLPVLINHV